MPIINKVDSNPIPISISNHSDTNSNNSPNMVSSIDSSSIDYNSTLSSQSGTEEVLDFSTPKIYANIDTNTDPLSLRIDTNVDSRILTFFTICIKT